MKLSFSIPSKSSSKATLKPSQTFTAADNHHDDQQQHKEFVSEFDPTKTLTDAPPKPFIIAPKENEWRPFKKMKNLDLPLQSDGSRDLEFELEAPSTAQLEDDKMSYGLNLRQTDGGGAAANQGIVDSGTGDGNVRLESAPVEAVLLHKLRDDLKRLPADRGFEEFADTPVEGFGAALLAGYGWCEGRGIGKNAKEDVKVKQYEKRTNKEGLGFIPEKSHSRSSENKGKGMEKKKENDRDGFSVGKEVRVIGGRNVGLKGRIVEKVGGDWVVLRLSKSEEEVKVRVFDIADLGSKEEKNCLKKLEELKIQEGDRLVKSTKSEKHASDRSRESGKRGSGELKRDEQQVKSGRERISWLRSHIRVRIISKELKGGRLYLKKGEVMDVVGPTTCDISMDESKELVQGVEQELLETALPRRGGPVLVLYGRHKGVYGNLVERDLDSETGIVRDADSHELLSVRLEQVAEYIGDPSYIGY